MLLPFVSKGASKIAAMGCRERDPATVTAILRLRAAKRITLGDNVWIDGGAILLPGVTVGDNSVIGAGSAVTKDVPANIVAVGNPARVIREIS